jgi:hypothetical protein
MKKRIIKLTESDLIKLVSKVINEQEQDSEAFEHYAKGLEDVYQDTFMSHHDGLTEEDIDIALDNLAQILDYAESDENISDDEFEELYEIYDEMASEMHIKFDIMNDLNETIEDEVEDEVEDEIHPARVRQLRHFDSDEFTLIGKIKAVAVPPSKTPLFVLRNKNKTEDGTRILDSLYGYEDKIVKLTGRTKDGNPPSFQNPMKLTKRPQVLSR